MASPPDRAEISKLAMHAEFLRAVARRLVRDDHRADDLVQDTWVAALESKRPPRGDVAGWMVGIARNLSRMATRTDIRRERRERAHRPARSAPDPHETVARLEAEALLIEAVRDLPEPYRGTLVARYLDGLSAAAVGRRTGVPASTVRTRVERALKMLRERLDRDSEGGRRAWVGALSPSPSPQAPPRARLSRAPSRKESRS